MCPSATAPVPTRTGMGAYGVGSEATNARAIASAWPMKPNHVNANAMTPIRVILARRRKSIEGRKASASTAAMMPGIQ